MPKGLRRLSALLAAVLLLAWDAPARADTVNCILILVKADRGIAPSDLSNLLYPVQKSLLKATNDRVSLFVMLGQDRVAVGAGDDLVQKCSQDTAVAWLKDTEIYRSHFRGQYRYRPDIWNYNSSSVPDDKTNPIVLTFGPRRMTDADCPFPPEEQAIWGVLALYYTNASMNAEETSIRKELLSRLTKLEKKFTTDRAYCSRLTGNDVYTHTLGILRSIRRSGRGQ